MEWCAVGSADNAASIAGMLLAILQCSKNFVPRLKCHRHFRICDIKEPVLWRRLCRQPAAPANPGMGGMGGMY